jgi:hypothetical protein
MNRKEEKEEEQRKAIRKKENEWVFFPGYFDNGLDQI